jgi:hypothetical protein
MTAKPRKPWRLLVLGPDVLATSDHGTKDSAYRLARASIGPDSPANTARVERWTAGRWVHHATLTG